jgi:heme/copper-type cytochrome/quinol oxidase subunit 3
MTPREPTATGLTLEKNRFSMVLFILSEAIFFAMLILAYAYFRASPQGGPSAASSLDPVRMGFFSAALFSSSATVWLAERQLKRRCVRGARSWLAATILLGITFLVGEGIEYAGLFARGITISTDLFGTTFFSLTGFHGLHVTAGLLLLTIVFFLAGQERYRWKWPVAVRSVSLYWHFVDAVWVAVFSVVYLWAIL